MAEGEVTRRLTTIVAIDVAGYSRLMGADEAGTLARLIRAGPMVRGGVAKSDFFH